MASAKICWGRDSFIELFRILTMVCIVAHHYVVNSGIIGEISQSNVMQINSLFSLLFGWEAKPELIALYLLPDILCANRTSA